LTKGNLFGLHALDVKFPENLSPQEFENFHVNKYIPAFQKALPGVQLFLYKGERGKNQGKQGKFIFFKSLDERNAWIP